MVNNVQSSGTLEKKLSEFSHEQRELITSNVGAIQLTEGCSIGCPDCGFGAQRGVNDYIPFDVLTRIVKNYKEGLKSTEPYFYQASDPFDYNFDGKKYKDVHNLFEKVCGFSAGTSTSVPKGKENEVLEFARSGNYLGISCSYMNRKRLQPYVTKFEGKKNVEVAIFDENKADKIKEMEKRFERDIFANYIYPNRRNFNPKKGDLDEIGIGCFNGVLMTPKGVYNVVSIKPNPVYPHGQIVREISPDKFKVVELFDAPLKSERGYFGWWINERLPLNLLTKKEHESPENVKKYWRTFVKKLGAFFDIQDNLNPKDLHAKYKKLGAKNFPITNVSSSENIWNDSTLFPDYTRDYEDVKEFKAIGIDKYFKMHYNIDVDRLNSLRKVNSHNKSALGLLRECEHLKENTGTWFRVAHSAYEIIKEEKRKPLSA